MKTSKKCEVEDDAIETTTRKRDYGKITTTTTVQKSNGSKCHKKDRLLQVPSGRAQFIGHSVKFRSLKASTLGLQLHDSTCIQKGRFQFIGGEKESQHC